MRLIAILAGAVLAPLVFAGDQPALFYSKAFPGSSPAYVQITLDPEGAVEYRA